MTSSFDLKALLDTWTTIRRATGSNSGERFTEGGLYSKDKLIELTTLAIYVGNIFKLVA
jgi:hypothetical protein